MYARAYYPSMYKLSNMQACTFLAFAGNGQNMKPGGNSKQGNRLLVATEIDSIAPGFLGLNGILDLVLKNIA